MRKATGLLLLLAGVGLFLHGYVLARSVRGATQKLGADVHAVWSGATPITPAMYFMLIGGLLVAAGAAGVLKK
jgi:hypothetical protein